MCSLHILQLFPIPSDFELFLVSFLPLLPIMTMLENHLPASLSPFSVEYRAIGEWADQTVTGILFEPIVRYQRCYIIYTACGLEQIPSISLQRSTFHTPLALCFIV